MNRIEKTFESLKEKEEKALVGFVTAGDPTISLSMELVTTMCNAGLDILELGVPFSDPTADGPVIQRSSARALQDEVTLADVLEMTKRLRRGIRIPIILFSYYNPILAYGISRFHEDAVSAGADGVLVVDLPPEESNELTESWTGNGLSLIRLIAPTTPTDRMKRISESAAGFLYMVSKTGVTGSDGFDAGNIIPHMAHLRSVSTLPVCVGFGISKAADVSALAPHADGIVIGSAFEKLIEENLENPRLAEILGKRVREYKEATRL